MVFVWSGFKRLICTNSSKKKCPDLLFYNNGTENFHQLLFVKIHRKCLIAHSLAISFYKINESISSTNFPIASSFFVNECILLHGPASGKMYPNYITIYIYTSLWNTFISPSVFFFNTIILFFFFTAFWTYTVNTPKYV